uniref:sialate O-acetylesterase n=1 Tax=uncultured Draconibacterium sp. TaxID=1573823 RepID=UPI0032178282
MSKIIFVALLFFYVCNISANIKVAQIFSDNMVLQADKPIVVWGMADVAESVTIQINNISAKTRAGVDGKWSLELSPMSYGGPYNLYAFGDDTVCVKNIMIGEVWLCAGQSNMRMTVRGAYNADNEISNANYDNIRFFNIPQEGAAVPADDVDAIWEVCSSNTVARQTAAGYYFGRELLKELKVAIGLIDISYGGANLVTFIDNNTIVQSQYENQINTLEEVIVSGLKEEIIKWENNDKVGNRPPFYPQIIPSFCYNAMVNPIVPYTLRGIVWYQGESDVDRPGKYIDWFGLYLNTMRKKFQDPELPACFVQLAGFENQYNTNFKPEVWAQFRLAQEKCLKYPNTGMITACDIGMKDDIHPKNKQEVGRRLSLYALNQVYDKTEIISQGPGIKSFEKEGDCVIITFNNCANGLKSTSKCNLVPGFWGIHENGNIVELKGKIIAANKVEVKIGKVMILRYAYANYPVCSLYNMAGLPALPFQIDL